MIASRQIANNEMLQFLGFVYEQKRLQKLLKNRLLFKKIENFTGKLLQNYK